MVRRVLAIAVAAALSAACAGAPGRAFAPPPAGTDEAAAREVLGRFVRALDAGRFDEAHALLSARWRLAYATPARLALDFRGGGGTAREAALRVAQLLAAGAPLSRAPDGTRLPIGGDRAARLVVEGGGWRVDALE
ncbi:MAG TPA: hypothetical protein VF894_07740 [Anaeromyxobacter sp.]